MCVSLFNRGNRVDLRLGPRAAHTPTRSLAPARLASPRLARPIAWKRRAIGYKRPNLHTRSAPVNQTSRY